MKLTVYLSLLWCLTGSMSALANAPVFGQDYQQAYQDYLQGVNEDEGAAKRALAEFTELVSRYPQDPLAQVYQGASNTLKGRDAWLPWNKLKPTELGLEQMQEAVTLLRPEHDGQRFQGLPVSLQVKGNTGIVFTQVPDFFNRFDQGMALLKQVVMSPLLTDLPATQWVHFQFYYALALSKEGNWAEAKTGFERVVSLAPESDMANAARLQLEQVEQEL